MPTTVPTMPVTSFTGSMWDLISHPADQKTPSSELRYLSATSVEKERGVGRSNGRSPHGTTMTTYNHDGAPSVMDHISRG